MQSVNPSSLSLRKAAFDISYEIGKELEQLTYSVGDFDVRPRINALFFKQISFFEQVRAFLDSSIQEKPSINMPYMASWCWDTTVSITEKVLGAFVSVQSGVKKEETFEAINLGKAQVLAQDAFFKAKKIEWILARQEISLSQEPIFQVAKQTQRQALEILAELNHYKSEKIIGKICTNIEKEIGGLYFEPLFNFLFYIDEEESEQLLCRLVAEKVITNEEKRFLKQQDLHKMFDRFRYQLCKISEKKNKSEVLMKEFLEKGTFPTQNIQVKKTDFVRWMDAWMSPSCKELRPAHVIQKEAEVLDKEIDSALEDLQWGEITATITEKDLQQIQSHLNDLIAKEAHSTIEQSIGFQDKVREVYREFFSGVSSFLRQRYAMLNGTENSESLCIKESRKIYEIAKEVRKDLKAYFSYLKKLGLSFDHERMELKTYTAIVRLEWLMTYLETLRSIKWDAKIQSWKSQGRDLFQELIREFPLVKNLNWHDMRDFCNRYEKSWKAVRQLKQEINRNSIRI